MILDGAQQLAAEGEELLARLVEEAPPQLHTVGAATLPDGQPAISFRAAVFASGEPVNLWYIAPSGESTALVIEGDVAFPQPPKNYSDTEQPTYDSSLAANSQGELMARVDIANLAPGAYTLAARGGWSGATASATFIVR